MPSIRVDPRSFAPEKPMKVWVIAFLLLQGAAVLAAESEANAYAECGGPPIRDGHDVQPTPAHDRCLAKKQDLPNPDRKPAGEPSATSAERADGGRLGTGMEGVKPDQDNRVDANRNEPRD
jgi:hypothetical protein